jgi:hypothetical protein
MRSNFRQPTPAPKAADQPLDGPGLRYVAHHWMMANPGMMFTDAKDQVIAYERGRFGSKARYQREPDAAPGDELAQCEQLIAAVREVLIAFAGTDSEPCRRLVEELAAVVERFVQENFRPPVAITGYTATY